MRRILAALIMAVLPFTTQAMDTAGYFKITSLWSWGLDANAAVVIQLETINSLCPGGYWFEESTGSGSKNLMSMALAAYYAKTPVKIYADETADWWGSGVKDCKLKVIAVGG